MKNVFGSAKPIHVLPNVKAQSDPEDKSTQKGFTEGEENQIPPLEENISAEPCPDEKKNESQTEIREINFDWKQPPEIIWEKIVKKVSEKHGILGTMLAKSSLLNISDEQMEIECNDNGLQFKRISKNIDKIRKICLDIIGKSPEITLKVNENAQKRQKHKVDQISRLKQEALDHPIVAEAIEIFNGQVIDVKIFKEDYS